jgi:hypothetical protein
MIFVTTDDSVRLSAFAALSRSTPLFIKPRRNNGDAHCQGRLVSASEQHHRRKQRSASGTAASDVDVNQSAGRPAWRQWFPPSWPDLRQGGRALRHNLFRREWQLFSLWRRARLRDGFQADTARAGPDHLDRERAL